MEDQQLRRVIRGLLSMHFALVEALVKAGTLTPQSILDAVDFAQANIDSAFDAAEQLGEDQS